MSKEIIISIVVIILIVILDITTVRYTSKAVGTLSTTIEEIKEQILNKDSEDKIQDNINKLRDEWDGYYKKLAYYLEHDELEKVETKLSRINGYAEAKEFEDALSELDETIFILSHIEDKEKFSFQSMF